MSYTALKNKVLSKVAGLVLEVEPLTDDVLRQDRLRKCEGNAGLCFDAENRRCKICTCYVEAKASIKVNRNPLKGMRHEVTHCPLGKWDDKGLANHYRELDGLPLL
ncbi:MAG TPA: hypothetical protein PLD32_09285 [Saprospiraceae bacterium]|nr:hypothetical protein [Saprospiraceae bacterium]